MKTLYIPQDILLLAILLAVLLLGCLVILVCLQCLYLQSIKRVIHRHIDIENPYTDSEDEFYYNKNIKSAKNIKSLRQSSRESNFKSPKNLRKQTKKLQKNQMHNREKP